MGIVERRVEWIRRERGGIVPIELHEGAAQSAGRRSIATAKSSAARSCRRDHHDCERRREEAQTTGTTSANSSSAVAGEPDGTPERGVEAGLAREPAEQGRARRAPTAPTWPVAGARDAGGNAPVHGPAPPRVSAASIRAEQGIEEYDALVAADAGEIRVAVRRAARAVHHEHAAARREAAALEQRLDALAERRVAERRKSIEHAAR